MGGSNFKYGVKNPDLEVEEAGLSLGDFVCYKGYHGHGFSKAPIGDKLIDIKRKVGIITGLNPAKRVRGQGWIDRISFVTLYQGLPEETEGSWPDSFGRELEKISRQDGIKHIRQIKECFQGEISAGALQGAMYARHLHYLNQILDWLERGAHPFSAVTDGLEIPLTGVYVVKANYENSNSRLEALALSPRMAENETASLLKILEPDGFGNTRASLESGHLVGYEVYEVPEEGLHMVEDRVRIQIEIESP